MSNVGFSPDSNNPIISGSTSVKATNKTDLPKVTKDHASPRSTEANKPPEAPPQPKTTPKAEAQKNAKHIQEVTRLKQQAKALEQKNFDREVSDFEASIMIEDDDTPL